MFRAKVYKIPIEKKTKYESVVFITLAVLVLRTVNDANSYQCHTVKYASVRIINFYRSFRKNDRFTRRIKKREISLRFATNERNQLDTSSITFDAMEFKVVKVEQLSEHFKDFDNTAIFSFSSSQRLSYVKDLNCKLGVIHAREL